MDVEVTVKMLWEPSSLAGKNQASLSVRKETEFACGMPSSTGIRVDVQLRSLDALTSNSQNGIPGGRERIAGSYLSV